MRGFGQNDVLPGVLLNNSEMSVLSMTEGHDTSSG